MSYSYGTSSQITLPDSANNVVTYIRERLGEPVIQVNVTDDQILARIADALQYWRDYNNEGTEVVYVAHELTEQEIDQKYIEINDDLILEIHKVIQPLTIAKNLFENIDYMMYNRLNFSDYASGTGMYLSSVSEFMLMREQLANISFLFKNQKNIKFNRHKGRLYYYGDWDMLFQSGQYLTYEATAIVDPEVYGKILSNRLFLDLATAMVKKQWGEILKKYSTIPLMGGQQLNGQGIYNEAVGDIDDAKITIQNECMPPRWKIG